MMEALEANYSPKFDNCCELLNVTVQMTTELL